MKPFKFFLLFVLFVFLSNTAFSLDPLYIHEYVYGSGGDILENTDLAEVDILIQDGFETVYRENYVDGTNGISTNGFGIFELFIGDGYGTPQDSFDIQDYLDLEMSRTLYVVVRIKVNANDPYRIVSRTSLWSLAYRYPTMLN